MRTKSLNYPKSKSRSIKRTLSPGLADYITNKYKKNIPIALITTAHKLFGRTVPLHKEDPFFRKFAGDKNNVDTDKILNYLSSN